MSPPDVEGYDEKGRWCGSVQGEIAYWKARAEKAEGKRMKCQYCGYETEAHIKTDRNTVNNALETTCWLKPQAKEIEAFVKVKTALK